jgi:hypothetical protein
MIPSSRVRKPSFSPRTLNYLRLDRPEASQRCTASGSDLVTSTQSNLLTAVTRSLPLAVPRESENPLGTCAYRVRVYLQAVAAEGI